MFKNVLIVEDQDLINNSLQRTMQELEVVQTDQAAYCSQALSQIKKSLHDGEPYDLLITDLYFETDDGKLQILEGTELIRQARTILPEIKVLIFSAEGRPAVMQSIYDELSVDGYVRKGRGDADELKKALIRIKKGQRFLPRELRGTSVQENMHVFTAYDRTIVSLLAKGFAQYEIPGHLLTLDIRPSSLSSVEKRLALIKKNMDFTNNEQLIAFCKEIMLI